jgi:5'-nucleotidase
LAKCSFMNRQSPVKKILYVDMDNVLVDFPTGIERIAPELRAEYEGRLDDVPGIFALMEPLKGAVEAYQTLSGVFDTYILSTAPWDNASAWSDKLSWVKRHLGVAAYKRLILSHHKNLNAGDFLVDDRLKNGADRFSGEHVHFGSSQFPNWEVVTEYLLSRQ